MKIIKRNGKEAKYDREKIVQAISKANAELPVAEQMPAEDIVCISKYITNQCEGYGRAPSVEEIQDLVEEFIISPPADAPWKPNYKLMKRYSDYRTNRAMLRKQNTTDGKIISLLELSNEDAKQENSNKNPIVNSTMRDYIAGEVSRDLSRRYYLPPDVVAAHDEGIIHVHDTDYHIQHMYNCCLINLEDMLQNGTIISGTLIEKPHRFLTACTIATQISAQVASNQLGGQSITLSHLAPFVEASRQMIRKDLEEELLTAGYAWLESDKEKVVEQRVRREVKAGVQVLQYQVQTLLSTNG